MKQAETGFKTKKKYVLIMVLCFLYGGFALFLFATEAYTAYWRADILNTSRFGPPDDFNRGQPPDFNRLADNNQNSVAGRFPRDPVAALTSPAALIELFGGIISLLAGLGIWNLIREKEIKKIKEETANHLLLPEERAIIEAVKKSGLESTQARLAKETGLSRVQIHRTLNRLEAKGLLEKHKYGLTNKIILKKEIFE
ncbi:MAG: MarR family transcriptional regulator [Candidatus Micrarchaeota archaeon]